MMQERVNRPRECIGEICWRLAGRRIGAKARSDPGFTYYLKGAPIFTPCTVDCIVAAFLVWYAIN